MKINRRDTLKTIVIGGLAVGTLQGCKTSGKESEESTPSIEPGQYGRTEEEKIRDAKLMAQPSFFTDTERQNLLSLMDIICPADEVSGSASEAGVMEFLDFIVYDMPDHQMKLRSGLAWMSRESNDRFGKTFELITDSQRLEIIDDIAYPGKSKPEHKPGEKFFSHLRNLTLTGFYTSELGVKDLDYKGNRPNFWNGVPEEVMKKHGFKLDEQYISQYVSETKRTTVATWDDDGNLI